jgi:hypothetical protein
VFIAQRRPSCLTSLPRRITSLFIGGAAAGLSHSDSALPAAPRCARILSEPKLFAAQFQLRASSAVSQRMAYLEGTAGS